MSDKLHGLIAFIKQFYQENGICPSIPQAIAAGHSSFMIRKYSMKQLKEMAGVEDVRLNQHNIAKISNDIFKRDIQEVVNEYQPREIIEQPIWPKILVLGDYHAPFHSKRATEKVIEYCKFFQPEYIVQIGDVFDMFSHSRFPRSHNIFTPKQEEELAREAIESLWKSLKEAAPKAICYQMIGNHDTRPLKRVLESAPTMEHWIQGYFKQLMSFDGVNTILDPREELEISGIIFTHGFLGGEGKHRDFYLKNVVLGHLHKLWVQYRRFHGQSFFELCVGFLGEPESKGLTYTPSKAMNYQLGFASIDQFGPRCVHL